MDAPELQAPDGRRAKALLEHIALGQAVTGEAQRSRSGRVIAFDRVIAVCRVRGRPIGDLLRALHAPEGGN
jgi:hypothetical protein